MLYQEFKTKLYNIEKNGSRSLKPPTKQLGFTSDPRRSYSFARYLDGLDEFIGPPYYFPIKQINANAICVTKPVAVSAQDIEDALLALILGTKFKSQYKKDTIVVAGKYEFYFNNFTDSLLRALIDLILASDSARTDYSWINFFHELLGFGDQALAVPTPRVKNPPLRYKDGFGEEMSMEEDEDGPLDDMPYEPLEYRQSPQLPTEEQIQHVKDLFGIKHPNETTGLSPNPVSGYGYVPSSSTVQAVSGTLLTSTTDPIKWKF